MVLSIQPMKWTQTHLLKRKMHAECQCGYSLEAQDVVGLEQVFEAMWEQQGSVDEIIEQRGLKQVSDSGAIEAAIDDILAANQDKVAEYRGGKDKLFGFFVGQVMKASKGQANPGMVNQLLRAKLDG